MTGRLGIIAGNGELPRRLVEACRASGRDCFILALEGEADAAALAGEAHAWARLGAAAKSIEILRQNGVEELVLAGGVRRPSLTSLRPDWRAAKMLARIGYRALGDDGLLKAVVRELEQEGFRVLAPDALLSSSPGAAGLMPTGPLGKYRSDAAAETDIARGRQVAHAIGALDIGQAVVVQQGLVLGIEAIEGTDALVRRCGLLRREGPGPILIKLAKPGQERRADRPTIGPRTISVAAEAGLRGIAAEAEATILLDRAAVTEMADAAGLFVIGISGE